MKPGRESPAVAHWQQFITQGSKQVQVLSPKVRVVNWTGRLARAARCISSLMLGAAGSRSASITTESSSEASAAALGRREDTGGRAAAWRGGDAVGGGGASHFTTTTEPQSGGVGATRGAEACAAIKAVAARTQARPIAKPST